MANEKGKTINDAFEIIHRTFQEVNLVKTDLEGLIGEADSTLVPWFNYSYGTNSLYLKTNHLFSFQKQIKNDEDKRVVDELIFAMLCIFYNDSELNRISLTDEPEAWFYLLRIKNGGDACGYSDLRSLLRREELINFENEKLIIGGEICRYFWKDESNDGNEWKGSFIGYPLTDIADSNFLKGNVIEPLFSERELFEDMV